MKPAGARLKLLPRTARRKLSTASVYTTQSSPLYFDVLPQTSQPSGSSSSHSGGPPRILKGPSQPTTAITHYSPPPTHSGSSSSAIAHPKYTTNSSHAYPGGNGLPLVWFVPNATNSGRSEIERRLPWEGPSEGKGKDRRTFSLEMGAYGIPKRRKNQHSEELEQQQQQQRNGDLRLSASAPTSSALSSPAASAGTSKEDPASYSLAVQVGEDAYFLRPDALGVADGVGGWKHKGESNSALFAKKLMHFCSYELARQQYPTPPPSNASTPTTTATPSTNSAPPPTSGPDPVQILQTSYERCIQDAKQAGMLGSSTATLAVLAESELRIAHVGDCVVCVVRDGEMVFRSEEMQHSFNYPYQLGPRSDTTPATHAQRLTVPVRANDIVILASDGMGDNLWDEDVLDEINRFIRTSPSPATASPSQAQSGSLSFSASSTTTTTSASSTSPLRTAHAPAGPVTNTVLAQRLSEALASRAKRVSERRAMTADASGTMGVFASKRMVIPPMPKGPPPPPPPSNRSASTTAAPLPIPARPSTTTQTPTPPPSPLMKPIPVIEGMELPIHRSITQSDGQLDDDVVLGDGFGGDGEYGGAGLGGLGFEEDEEPEWVRDEIPFGRKAREAGVRFVGGKGDDISVLVAIISSVPEPTTEPPLEEEPFHASSAMDALAKLRLNSAI